jgi:hypothetical protein
MTMLDHALRYAELGLAVFPCNGKVPMTSRGFKDASTDEEQIRSWWRTCPKANIGMPTGRITKTFVLDVDAGSGGLETLEALQAEHGPIETRTARTGGGGLHFYFLYPDGAWGNRAGFLPGLDIRGDGGYVIVPPSSHQSGGSYAWLAEVPRKPAPQWLLAQLSRPVEGNQKRGNQARIPERVPDGQRNDTLFRAACRLRAMGAGSVEIAAALEILNGRCDSPLAEGELMRIADSASRYPSGTSTGRNRIYLRNGLVLRPRKGGA